MQSQVPAILLLTALALGNAEVFTKPSYETNDCRGNVCGGPLICQTGYEMRCETVCDLCTALGENYTSRSTEIGGCSRGRYRSQCCTCAAPQLPPPAVTPVEVNTSCHEDGEKGWDWCKSCESTLVCPAGYTLSSERSACRSSCGVFGPHYVESSSLSGCYTCPNIYGDAGWSRSCRQCEPAEPLTTITATTTSASHDEPGSEWEPVDGGHSGRACRGDNATDNSPSYYVLGHAAELAVCKARCASAPLCFGIEFGHRRCEVWTRAIGASANVTGFECLRFAGRPESFTILP